MNTFAIGASGYLANFAFLSECDRAQRVRHRLRCMQAHMDAIARPHHYVNPPRGNVAPRIEEITA